MLPLDQQNHYRARYARLQPGWRTSGDEFESAMRRHVTPDSRVLDVGCGRGGVMELFWRDVALPVGVDPDWASLHEHRTRPPLPAGEGVAGAAAVAPLTGVRANSMPLTCAFAERLPFRDSSFDTVIALWVLEHLPEPERVFHEIARVLAPGGVFLFLTPNALHPLLWANRTAQWLPAVQRAAQRALIPRLYGRAEADTFRVHYRANTPARLRALAAQCGFRVQSLRAIADPTYLAFNDALFQLSVMLERLLPKEWGVHLLGEWKKELLL
ncbi:MAG: methyltransferase domain-containing protein [Anaerolineales bacterium]